MASLVVTIYFVTISTHTHAVVRLEMNSKLHPIDGACFVVLWFVFVYIIRINILKHDFLFLQSKKTGIDLTFLNCRFKPIKLLNTAQITSD